MPNPPKISPAFQLFGSETPEFSKAWMAMTDGIANVSALDPKTRHLAYLAVLAAVEKTSGIPFHVGLARQSGASREEILSALLVGLPAVGHGVTASLPAAVEALDALEG